MLPGALFIYVIVSRIHGQDSSITYNLALQHNISIQPQILDTQTFRSDGSLVDGAFMDEVMRYALPLMEAHPEKPEPLGVFMTRKLVF